MTDPTSTPVDRKYVNPTFNLAGISAQRLVLQAIADLGRSEEKDYPARQALIDEILHGVATIGTPEFQEHRVLTDRNVIPEFDIRIDWPVMLLAWCRSWAHTAFIDPEGTKLQGALAALETTLIKGKGGLLSWAMESPKISRDLGIAIFTELRDTHKLVGPWRITAKILEGRSPTAPGVYLEAKVLHCDIAFKCSFMKTVVLADDVWELERLYNAAIERQASVLEHEAADMVEHAVRASLPLRAQAASLRAKMTKKTE